jgi:hypothetical protein
MSQRKMIVFINVIVQMAPKHMFPHEFKNSKKELFTWKRFFSSY